MELIIAQINAQRSAAVAADLRVSLANSGIDIICIQEPYSSNGRVRGYGLKARIFQPNTDAPMAAIVVNSPDLDVLQLSVESSHVIAIQVTSEGSGFYLVSAYFQFSHPVEPYLAQLETCIERIRRNNSGNEIIVAADVNALSTSWFARTTDERGDAVDDFIMGNNLTVLNRPSIYTTYASPSGTSNIDVTLATSGMAGRVCDWRVQPDLTISDHNAVIFRIVSGGPNRTQLRRSDLCFNLRRANWDLFEQELRKSFDVPIKVKLATAASRQAVTLFSEKLQEICRKVLGTRRSFSKTVPWWNADLTTLRKKVQIERAQLQRTRRLGLTAQVEHARSRYKTCRAESSGKLDTAK